MTEWPSAKARRVYAALLRIVTSANVACGFHAGDPDIMSGVFAQAREAGGAVGAVVSGLGHSGLLRLPKPVASGLTHVRRCIAQHELHGGYIMKRARRVRR